MAERRNKRDVCLEYTFDRLLVAKLEQVYRTLVSDRVRVVGESAEGGEHHCQPNGGAESGLIVRELPFPARETVKAEEVGFAVDSPLEGDGFELVWGFSCQAVVWVVLTVFCSERERPFFVPSPAIRFADRAEGVKGPKR